MSLWTSQAKQNHLNRNELVEWAQRLDKQVSATASWSHFLTMTFRPEKAIKQEHAETAGPRLLRWCSKWGRAMLGFPVFRLLLWSAEAHATGLVHLHALSVNSPHHSKLHCERCKAQLSLDEPDWKVLKESWYIHWGIARIYPYDKSLGFGAERYVTKYVLDETCLDWGVERW